MATGGMALSKEFFELIKAIGESKSKQEEDRIMSREVLRLKQKLEPTPTGVPHPLQTSKKRAKEFLVRLLYVEMLGHDASFGYIKAVEMAASASLYHKRTGYLICACCLPPNHEFRFMLVNQMQRDLQSTNVLEVCGGLLACTNLITSDMVPAVSSEVSRLLSTPHESATIRKKSVVTLHRFHQLDSDVVTTLQMQDVLRKTLCDKDPSVMGACLNVLENMTMICSGSDLQPFKDLVPSLVSILKQVGEHRLPTDYEYHRIPAPWIQMKLIRILGILGRSDATSSAGMYEVLGITMRNADAGINAGYAIVYECIRTIVRIYPNTTLLDQAAAAISRFMESKSHNLKYLGVTGLALIVEQHAQYAASHQLAVMDCLEDPDETLQRKTLDLLYRMTNPVNVEFIAEKLIEFLQHTTTDIFLKRILSRRVCYIAERYAPNNAWYIQTMIHLFQVAGDLCEFSVAQNLMSLIAEGGGGSSGDSGGGDSEEADMLLRQTAVELFVDLLHKKQAALSSLPRILLETMAWCLGEYGYLSAVSTLDDVLQRLCHLLIKTNALQFPMTTRQTILQAILKLVAQAGTCPAVAAICIDEGTRSSNADLQTRCLEFQGILTACPELLPEILPVDASAEDVDVDVNLHFLDTYVQTALQNGAQPYEKPEDDDDDDDDDDGAGGRRSNGYGYTTPSGAASAFNMTPYEKPQQPSSSSMMHMSGMGRDTQRNPHQGVSLPPGVSSSSSMGGGGGGHGHGGSHDATTMPSSGPPSGGAPGGGGGLALNTRHVANVWGRGGLNTGGPVAPPGPAAVTAPAPAAPAPAVAKTRSWDTGGMAVSSSSSPYGGAAAATQAPVQQPKTAAQLEKERKAAAFFGGIVPGAAPPPPPVPRPVPTAAPPPPPPQQQPMTAPPSAPPVAPAPPEIDLLDMSAWDAPAPAAAASAPAAANPTFDVLSPTPPAVVETVSDDYEDMDNVMGGAAATSAPPAPAAPAPPTAMDDPFAGAGLLSDVSDAPLATLSSGFATSKFEFNGTPMAPFPITTAQFGQQWAACKATSPGSVTTTKITTLAQFMDMVKSIVGAHPVEAIATTNEGICAGMVGGGSQYALIHAKLTSLATGGTKIDLTVKSTDASLGGSLAMYMQTMLR